MVRSWFPVTSPIIFASMVRGRQASIFVFKLTQRRSFVEQAMDYINERAVGNVDAKHRRPRAHFNVTPCCRYVAFYFRDNVIDEDNHLDRGMPARLELPYEVEHLFVVSAFKPTFYDVVNRDSFHEKRAVIDPKLLTTKRFHPKGFDGNWRPINFYLQSECHPPEIRPIRL